MHSLTERSHQKVGLCNRQALDKALLVKKPYKENSHVNARNNTSE